LLSKLDGYLCEIESTQWKQEHPEATVKSTRIIVKLHPDSDAVFTKLLDAYSGWFTSRGAQLAVEQIE
jgi:hypothetical protein